MNDTNNTSAPQALLDGWMRTRIHKKKIRYMKLLNSQFITVTVGMVYDENVAITLLQAMDKRAEEWKAWHLAMDPSGNYPIWSGSERMK